EDQIVATLARKSYQPIKPKALARKLGVTTADYGDFRRSLKELIKQGRVEIGKNHTVRPTPPHGTVTGTFRRAAAGFGYVRPHLIDGHVGTEVYVRQEDTLDAATGDDVLVRVLRKPNRPDLSPVGKIVRVIERATRQFVGTYFE